MPSDTFSPIFSGLIERGFSPAQAAALTGNIQQESNGNPAALNQGEGANGLLQWRLDRWDALQNFAKERGTSPTDVNTQLDFIGREMRGSEAKSAAPFLQAQDLPSANAALRKYIRYGDDSEPQRLKYASAFMGGAPLGAPRLPQMTADSGQMTPIASQLPASAVQAQAMPGYGFSSQNAPAATATGQPQMAAQPEMTQPPQMQPIGAPRRPPNIALLQAFLQQHAPASPGLRFLGRG